MKKKVLISIAFLQLCFIGFSQSIPNDSLYLGQTPPGNIPVVFQLGVNSGLRPVERITISSDNKEIYYGEQDTWPPVVKRIKCYKYIADSWQGPFNVFEGFVDPALSVNDSVMYMQKQIGSAQCTFFSVRNGTGWTTPVRLLSTNQTIHYFQETQLNNYYCASTPAGNSDICKLVINGSDTVIQSLGKPINTAVVENDYFIARDESYIIVFRLSSPLDLFISYNNGYGGWTNPKSLGVNINTPIYECSPFVTRDNKYLFFTRGGNTMSSYSIYWVKIDNIIDSLKYTNYIPYLKNPIPDQNATIGQQFSYTILDTIFIDDDGNNTLTYSATLSNGNPLPTWLVFEPSTRTFTGTPIEAGSLSIKVTAKDNAMASVSDVFSLNVPVGINEIDKQGILIYPNPSKGIINIMFGSEPCNNSTIQVLNVVGGTILTENWNNTSEVIIDLTVNSKGIYFLKLMIDGKTLVKKIVLE